MPGLIGLSALAADAAAAIGNSGGGGAQDTIRTPVKTAAYTASPSDLIPVDTTAAAVTVTLPAAPADRSRVAVKLIAGTNPVTIACAGSDVLNKAAGSTSAALTVVNQGVTYQYNAASGIWTGLSGDLPLSQLDLRYPPRTSPTFAGTLQMSSDGTGGTGINPTSDTTGHIVVPSYQTNSSVAALSPGEGIRMQVMNGIAKNMIAWQMPRPLATGGTGTLKSTVWIGAHYFDQNDGTTVHGHWSLEVPDASDSLRTRFEVKICDASGNFLDKTLVQTANADLVVDASNAQVLRIRSGAGAARYMEWANDQWGTAPRWRVGVPSDAGETGSNAGSDFEIKRYNDSGTGQVSSFTILRSSGRITIGGSDGSSGGVDVKRNSTGTALGIQTTATGATAYTHTANDAATSRTIEAKVTGESGIRAVLYADGSLEVGDGTNARDVKLSRLAAKTLGLAAGQAFRAGTTTTGARPTAATVGAGTQMYDTTLSKPIWSDGTTWRDAAGATA